MKCHSLSPLRDWTLFHQITIDSPLGCPAHLIHDRAGGASFQLHIKAMIVPERKATVLEPASRRTGYEMPFFVSAQRLDTIPSNYD